MGAEGLRKKYIQQAITNLVKALNDEGRLGLITKRLLDIQAGMLEKHPNLDKGDFTKILTHSSTIRAVQLMKQTDLEIFWKGNKLELKGQINGIRKVMERVEYDPLAFGIKLRVPDGIITQIWDIGYTSIEQLMSKDKHKGLRTMLDCNSVQSNNGNRVLTKHMIAINQLTILLNKSFHPGDNINKVKAQPLSIEQRTVHRDYEHLIDHNKLQVVEDNQLERWRKGGALKKDREREVVAIQEIQKIAEEPSCLPWCPVR